MAKHEKEKLLIMWVFNPTYFDTKGSKREPTDDELRKFCKWQLLIGGNIRDWLIAPSKIEALTKDNPDHRIVEVQVNGKEMTFDQFFDWLIKI